MYTYISILLVLLVSFSYTFIYVWLWDNIVISQYLSAKRGVVFLKYVLKFLENKKENHKKTTIFYRK